MQEQSFIICTLKTGKLSVTLTTIKSDENSEDVKLPEEIHEISVTSNYIPEGMEWIAEGYKLGYKDTFDTAGITVDTV